jgi:hypothetical protein
MAFGISRLLRAFQPAHNGRHLNQSVNGVPKHLRDDIGMGDVALPGAFYAGVSSGHHNGCASTAQMQMALI